MVRLNQGLWVQNLTFTMPLTLWLYPTHRTSISKCQFHQIMAIDQNRPTMTTWHSISQLILPIVSQSPLIRPKPMAMSHHRSAGRVLLMAIGQPWLTAILSSLSKVLPRSIENLAVVLVWKEKGNCCGVKLLVCESKKVVVWCESRMGGCWCVKAEICRDVGVVAAADACSAGGGSHKNLTAAKVQ